MQESGDIELCRELKERQNRILVPTGKFEALDESTPVMKQTVPYEHVFIRYKDNGTYLYFWLDEKGHSKRLRSTRQPSVYSIANYDRRRGRPADRCARV